MQPDRSIATALFTDIVGSTERAEELGDRAWRSLHEQHHTIVREELARFEGREISEMGDGFLSLFDNPAQAILCAAAIRDRVRDLGLETRCGVHMGQVEHHADDSMGGLTLHIGSRVASAAGPGEILVSSTVRDAERGSEFVFDDRGRHDLKGVTGEWQLFEVTEIPEEAAAEITQPHSKVGPLRLPRLPPQTRARAIIGGALALVLIFGLTRLFELTRDGALVPSEVIVEDAVPKIAVLPFRVQGGANVDLWREGMVDLVSTNIDVFSEVSAVPSRTVLAQWREAGLDDSADMAEALDVARETGARYAVTGSVLGTSEGLRIRGEMYDLKSGAKVGDAVALGAPDSILALVDRLSVELFNPLLETEARNGRPRLAHVTSASPLALQAFLDGERLFRSGQYEGAIEAYLRAVDTDSTFALAYYRLGDVTGWSTGGVDGGKYAEMATRYADRLPERERRFVRALGFAYEGDPRRWIETLKEAVRMHPSDAEAWYRLGEAILFAGYTQLVPRQEFVDALERSVALDPGFFPAYNHLINAAFILTPDSAHAADLLERQARVGETKIEDRIAFDLVFGDADRQRAARARLDDLTPLELQFISDWSLAHPRFLDLKELALRTALNKASPNFELHHRVRLFWTLLGRGKVAEALTTSQAATLGIVRPTLLYEARQRGYPIPDSALVRSFAEAPTEVADPADAPAIFERGAYAAELADWATHGKAKRDLGDLISEVEPDNARDTLRLEGLVEALDGYAVWRGADRETALRLLLHAREATAGGTNFNKGMIPRTRMIHWWLAELLVEMNRPQEALPFYESTIGRIQQDPMAFFRVAQLRDQLGDPEGALHDYELAAVAWRDADPALRPFAEAARSEAARLRGLIRR